MAGVVAAKLKLKKQQQEWQKRLAAEFGALDDADGDGKISLEEATAAFGGEERCGKAWLQALDEDGDGFVSGERLNESNNVFSTAMFSQIIPAPPLDSKRCTVHIFSSRCLVVLVRLYDRCSRRVYRFPEEARNSSRARDPVLSSWSSSRRYSNWRLQASCRGA